MCVATQTEDTCTPSMSHVSTSCQTEPLSKELPQLKLQQEQKQQLIILPPKVGKGTYPCHIGSCMISLPHGRMINHLRYYHKDSYHEVPLGQFHWFIQVSIAEFLKISHTPFPQFCIIAYDFQVSSKCNMFKQNLTLEYTLREYNYAFSIRGMGLFFLYLSVDFKGNLFGAVHIVNCSEAAKQFMYTLKVGSGPQGVCYSAAVRVHLYKLYITVFYPIYKVVYFQTESLSL